MKPFNLGEALAGKPVVTRSGTPVTQISQFKVEEDSFYSVVGVMNGNLSLWHKSGKWSIDIDELHIFDLVMATEKKSLWINLYNNNEGDLFVVTYKTEVEAKDRGMSTYEFEYIKTIEITNEIEL